MLQRQNPASELRRTAEERAAKSLPSTWPASRAWSRILWRAVPGLHPMDPSSRDRTPQTCKSPDRVIGRVFFYLQSCQGRRSLAPRSLRFANHPFPVPAQRPASPLEIHEVGWQELKKAAPCLFLSSHLLNLTLFIEIDNYLVVIDKPAG